MQGDPLSAFISALNSVSDSSVVKYNQVFRNSDKVVNDNRGLLIQESQFSAYLANLAYTLEIGFCFGLSVAEINRVRLFKDFKVLALQLMPT